MRAFGAFRHCDGRAVKDMVIGQIVELDREGSVERGIQHRQLSRGYPRCRRVENRSNMLQSRNGLRKCRPKSIGARPGGSRRFRLTRL